MEICVCVCVIYVIIEGVGGNTVRSKHPSLLQPKPTYYCNKRYPSEENRQAIWFSPANWNFHWIYISYISPLTDYSKLKILITIDLSRKLLPNLTEIDKNSLCASVSWLKLKTIGLNYIFNDIIYKLI